VIVQITSAVEVREVCAVRAGERVRLADIAGRRVDAAGRSFAASSARRWPRGDRLVTEMTDSADDIAVLRDMKMHSKHVPEAMLRGSNMARHSMSYRKRLT